MSEIAPDKYERNPHYKKLKNYVSVLIKKAEKNKSNSVRLYDHNLETILQDMRVALHHGNPDHLKIDSQWISEKIKGKKAILHIPDKEDCSISEITYFDWDLGIWVKHCMAARINGVYTCDEEKRVYFLGGDTKGGCPNDSSHKYHYWEIWD